MGFPRQEYWSELSFPSPGDLLDTMIETAFPTLAGGFFNTELPAKPWVKIQFSRSVMSNSSWPHGLQHARPPCPSPNPRVYSDSCPSSWWCHQWVLRTIVLSVEVGSNFVYFCRASVNLARNYAGFSPGLWVISLNLSKLTALCPAYWRPAIRQVTIWLWAVHSRRPAW